MKIETTLNPSIVEILERNKGVALTDESIVGIGISIQNVINVIAKSAWDQATEAAKQAANPSPAQLTPEQDPSVVTDVA